MIPYIIAADLTAALFILVLIVTMHVTSKKPNKKTKAYMLSLWVCFIGLIFNALSYLLSGHISSNFLVGAVNYLAFIFIDVVIASYGLYFYYMVKERVENFSKYFLFYIFALCIADFIFLTIGTALGKLFTVENGTYIGGPWWNYCPIIPTVCVASIFIILTIKFRQIGNDYALPLISYLLLTFLCAILQLIDVNIELGYVGFAISLLIIYIMLQSKIVYESRIRAEVYSELSTVDVLTGLKNRRAYHDIVEEYKGNESVAAVFSDLNNLKFINDTLGHDSGDKYIQKFADLMRANFPDAFLCRFSGDEFVILIKNIDKETLDARMKKFFNVISENNDIASCGYSLGTGSDIYATMKEAEKQMYAEKEKYYKRKGNERRLLY